MQHNKVASLLSKYIGKPISHIDSLASAAGSSFDFSPGSSMNQGMGSPPLSLNPTNPAVPNNAALAYQLKEIPEMEKTHMADTAASAIEELLKSFEINEPLWIKSPGDGRYLLNRDSYDKIFPRPNHFKSSSARVESSKDSGVVSISAEHLVDIFLDSVSAITLTCHYFLCIKPPPSLCSAGTIKEV